ncbi:MAG: DinB family protein, partial [Gemmatimonadetes bacterium]|nr:DinB family protein [Gemmatimonadota bacterium]
GTADGVRAWLGGLHDDWRARLAAMDEAALASHARTRWPFTDRPFADVVAWANVELAKNAAELGYARFLYAVRDAAR